MKVWTYGELDDKVRLDTDMQDTDLVTADEMVGYCNDAIDYAEAKIHKLGIEDEYFLKRGPLALTTNQAQYTLPADIYANKIRGIEYRSGSVIYDFHRIRRSGKFGKIAELEQYPDTQEYAYHLHNPSAGAGVQLEIIPPARETTGGTATVTIATPGVVTWNSHGLANSQAVRLFTTGALPTGLAEETTYYVVNATTNSFELAASVGGASITTSGTQSGVHTVAKWPLVATIWYIRNANRVPLVSAGSSAATRAALVDIPEFSTFILQFMKVRCMGKEGDPRVPDEMAVLKELQDTMITTLTEMIPDDENTVEMDLSHYQEHN